MRPKIVIFYLFAFFPHLYSTDTHNLAIINKKQNYVTYLNCSSRFPLLLGGLLPYVGHHITINVLSALLNKTFPSFLVSTMKQSVILTCLLSM